MLEWEKEIDLRSKQEFEYEDLYTREDWENPYRKLLSAYAIHWLIILLPVREYDVTNVGEGLQLNV